MQRIKTIKDTEIVSVCLLHDVMVDINFGLIGHTLTPLTTDNGVVTIV